MGNPVFTTPKNAPVIDENYTPEAPGLSFSDVSDPISDVGASEPTSRTQMMPDGSAIINMGESGEEGGESLKMIPFMDNIAAHLDEGDMTSMAMDLIESYEADKRSRFDWEKTYKDGLPLLGFKIETRTDPWPNACGVYHPVMAEAAVRFLASAMTESFPARGPVKTTIIGKWTREKEKKSKRVQEEMNYQLTEVMREYRQETEQVIWRMSIAGSSFRKIYFDPLLGRPTAMCVYPENLVVPYGVTHLEGAERFTHELFYTENQIEALQVAGVYRGVDIGQPIIPISSPIETAKDKITGMSPTIEVDNRHEILEMYVDLVIDDVADGGGQPCPYIVTIDKTTSTILSIYRNWNEQDQLRKKIMNFVHYQFMPGFGFYGLGLINILGGLTKAATSMLRQLVDAGTLSNLRAGYKTRGLRIKGDNRPLEPGELRDIDVMSGTLRDNIYFPDFKGPSAELSALLGAIVEEARKIGSVADMKVSEVSGEMPVGTVLAIFERNMKVQSAIQARLHASLKEEFKILAGLIAEHSARYDYEIDGDPAIIREDFNTGIIDIIPVSDPNATTMSQRMIMHQAVMNMAKEAPHLYDLPELHRRALDIMGMKEPEKIIPDTSNMPPMDPVTENMAIINMKPVKAALEQDHESHIKVHMAAMKDPMIMSLMEGNPAAQGIMAAAAAHMQEHIAFAYRRKIEKAMGVPLPPPGEPMPPDLEYNYSSAVADAAEMVLEESKTDIAKQKAQEALDDPIVKLQEREQAVKEMDARRKVAKDMADAEFKDKQLQQKSLLELARQGSTERAFKAEHVNNSVQQQAEQALAKRQQMFKEQQHGQSMGAKILDRMLQEETKRQNEAKKSLQE
jgi:hypothetical protein